ncbi:MAG TPA: condensation domain-containing protein, partial [Acidobacteriaceae bacterium]|nr:condensation domain-containing protein [Acidobacteriaceae bacterium]
MLARPEGHRDPVYLLETMRRNSITTAHFVPSMLRAFLEHAKGPECSTLVHVVCSGEILSPMLAQRFHQMLPGSTLYNLYGPTEATVDVTAWSCSPDITRATIPIGKPIANTLIYILDGYGEPVPVGVVGELYIGGAGVGRGYLNRPELTAERFLKDPFAGDSQARMYRTGDLGRWLPDGNIEFLGRNDFQVKVRGFRIELGEIEARLGAHPGVREAVVIAREDTPEDRRLVAYYTVAVTDEEEQSELSAEELRSHLASTLPEYMVPAAYVRMETWPLTPNGKLDRKALPTPEMDAYGVRGYEAPLGEIETTLATLWAEVLQLERVGRHDNFFALGGHSLLAVTLIERMRRIGLQADIRALFATSTLADLATTVDADTSLIEIPPNLIPSGCEAITPQMLPLVELSEEEIGNIVSYVPGAAANVQDIYPLAPLQEGILFHHLMGGQGDPYLLSTLFSFDSRDRLDRYLEAMQAVIDRHDILRTAIVWEGITQPVQVVWRRAILPVEEVALQSAEGDAAQQLYARFDPRRYRMEVNQAPLLRVAIAYDERQGRWLMMLLRHHLVGDHNTLEVLREEVRAHLLGQSSQLPAPLPFRNLVAQARLGVSREEHEVFFRKLLGDVEEPTAPFGLLEVRGDGTGIEEARVVLDATLVRRMRERGRKLGVSAASLCHLAWALVLARVSGRQDVVFGTVLFGRMQGGVDAERAMGLFINTLPLRIQIGEQGVEAAVRHTHVLLADLLRHEHASLALAQRCSAVPAPMPLFSALLNYRHNVALVRPVPPAEMQTREGIRKLYGEERTNYPFTLSVDDWGEGLALTAQTLASIDPRRVCQFMQTALEGLVEALETTPSAALHTLPILPPAERHQVLYEW